MAETTAADRRTVRDVLVLALDLDDLERARRLARSVAPYFATVKVGLELYAAYGRAAVEALVADGHGVFLDLKLHDIPTTVGRASEVLGRLGIGYATVHAAGGPAMLRAAVEGFSAGAAEALVPAPVVVGVTVLTSEPDAPRAVLEARTTDARDAGLGGVVCAAPDLGIVGAVGPKLLLVVPGTRPLGATTHDQARTATPKAAIEAGAGLLVIGRNVTHASDPVAASEDLHASLAGVRWPGRR